MRIKRFLLLGFCCFAFSHVRADLTPEQAQQLAAIASYLYSIQTDADSTASSSSSTYSNLLLLRTVIEDHYDDLANVGLDPQGLSGWLDYLEWYLMSDGSIATYNVPEMYDLFVKVLAGSNIYYDYPGGWVWDGTNENSIVDSLRKSENFFDTFNDGDFDSASWSNMRQFFLDYYDESSSWSDRTEYSVTNMSFSSYAQLNWFEKISCMLWSINANLASLVGSFSSEVNENQIRQAAEGAKNQIYAYNQDLSSGTESLFGHINRMKESLSNLTQGAGGNKTLVLWEEFQPFGPSPNSSRSASSSSSITIPRCVVDMDQNSLYLQISSVTRAGCALLWSVLCALLMIAANWYVIAFGFSLIMWAWLSFSEMKPVPFKFYGVWFMSHGSDL